MKAETIQYLKDEIKEFESMTQKFVKKEINMKEYKGFSGGFGSYSQRGGELFMLRLRMNHGVITKTRLKFLIDTLKKYEVNRLHITTCQTCQLHNLPADVLGTIMRDALDVGIVTRGGGGNYPRNVMCSPLSGVECNEYFDVLPYAKATNDYLIENIHLFHLPRKLKIGFSNNEENKTHTTFRDLGFCANEDQTFDVYIAGGLGNQPKMGVKVGTHVAKEDVLYHVETMVQLFQKYGNYENRAKARTRFMQDTLGVEGLYNAYQEILKEVYNLDLTLSNNLETKVTKSGKGKIEHPNVIAQKQEGLYALHLHPIGGDISIEQLCALAKEIETMDDIEMRISPQQDLYIINLTSNEVEKLLPLTTSFAKTQFDCSVSCIGASICQVGLRNSNGLLHQLLTNIRPYEFKDGILPKLHISGCTSSCGTHQIAQMGLQGSIKVIDKTPKNAYVLTIYGNDTRNDSRFGITIGTILEEKVETMLIDLGNKLTKENMTFYEFCHSHLESCKEFLINYTKD